MSYLYISEYNNLNQVIQTQKIKLKKNMTSLAQYITLGALKTNHFIIKDKLAFSFQYFIKYSKEKCLLYNFDSILISHDLNKDVKIQMNDNYLIIKFINTKYELFNHLSQNLYKNINSQEFDKHLYNHLNKDHFKQDNVLLTDLHQLQMAIIKYPNQNMIDYYDSKQKKFLNSHINLIHEISNTQEYQLFEEPLNSSKISIMILKNIHPFKSQNTFKSVVKPYLNAQSYLSLFLIFSTFWIVFFNQKNLIKSTHKLMIEPTKSSSYTVVLDKKNQIETKMRTKNNFKSVQNITDPTLNQGVKTTNISMAIASRIQKLLNKASNSTATIKNYAVTESTVNNSKNKRALASLQNLTTQSGNSMGSDSSIAEPNGALNGLKNSTLNGSLKLDSSKIGQGKIKLIEEESENSGGLEKEVIAQYIKTQLGQILYCYERQLSANPDLIGKVSVKFTIDSQGQIASSHIQQTSLNNRPIENCILAKINQWRFPTPKGGNQVVVTYPFLFKSI